MHHLVCIIGVYKPEEICKLGSFQAELTHRNRNKRKGNWVGAAGEISDSGFCGFAKTLKRISGLPAQAHQRNFGSRPDQAPQAGCLFIPVTFKVAGLARGRVEGE